MSRAKILLKSITVFSKLIRKLLLINHVGVRSTSRTPPYDMKGLVAYCVVLMNVVSTEEARRECPLIAGTSRYHPLNVKEAGTAI